MNARRYPGVVRRAHRFLREPIHFADNREDYGGGKILVKPRVI